MSIRSVCAVIATHILAFLLVTGAAASQALTGFDQASTGASAVSKAAGDCLVGPGPAATLLVPYFELDLDDGSLTTLVAVANAYRSETLCRVVLWTDWGIPSLAFDILLIGFDIQTFNLRDIFFNGIIPSTGDGENLESYDYCDTLPPFHTNPVLSSNDLARLAAMHTGQMDSTTKNCSAEGYGDNVARGYITIDVVDECSGVEAIDPVFTPANTLYPYFVDGGGEAGIATTENKLWGDVIYVDDTNNYAQASEAVAIWADPDSFTDSNIYTFYGRYSGWDGRDDRVPLPTIWNQRFLDGGPFAGAASVIVWRDTGTADVDSVDCGDGPGWRPLEGSFPALDEDGHNVGSADSASAPLATQRVIVGNLGIPASTPFGWIQVNTHESQSWVQPSLAAFGRFSASFNGTPVWFLCDEAPLD
jgi:hypothetical protein